MTSSVASAIATTACMGIAAGARQEWQLCLTQAGLLRTTVHSLARSL